MARPTSYDSKFCDLLIKHMTEGLSYESFAGRISVSRRVLFDWETRHEEFLHAKEIGVEKSRLFWEQSALRGAYHRKIKDESEPKGFRIDKTPIIPAVWIFNMKNRFQWRDRQPDESDIIVNNVGTLSEAELDARIKMLEAKKHDAK